MANNVTQKNVDLHRENKYEYGTLQNDGLCSENAVELQQEILYKRLNKDDTDIAENNIQWMIQ